jgi:transketolase
MRHLNSGEIKLFNIKTDYREQHDLTSEMPERVKSMDAIRAKYVQEVDGGTAEQVREALYDTMDTFGERAKEAYKKKLADLKEQKPANFDEQKTAMLKELNKKLIKNEINKEKCRRQATFSSWRESASKDGVEDFVLSRWVDYTGE